MNTQFPLIRYLTLHDLYFCNRVRSPESQPTTMSSADSMCDPFLHETWYRYVWEEAPVLRSGTILAIGFIRHRFGDIQVCWNWRSREIVCRRQLLWNRSTKKVRTSPCFWVIWYSWRLLQRTTFFSMARYITRKIIQKGGNFMLSFEEEVITKLIVMNVYEFFYVNRIGTQRK